MNGEDEDMRLVSGLSLSDGDPGLVTFFLNQLR